MTEKIAALYVRCSTKKQVEEGSHIRQQRLLESWAEDKGHEYETFVDGGISGRVDERDTF